MSSRNRWWCTTTEGRKSSRWGNVSHVINIWLWIHILIFSLSHFQKLEEADDDSYMDSEWSDRQALKRQFQGLTNIKWGPRWRPAPLYKPTLEPLLSSGVLQLCIQLDKLPFQNLKMSFLLVSWDIIQIVLMIQPVCSYILEFLLLCNRPEIQILT